jgi:hypothetical protein
MSFLSKGILSVYPCWALVILFTAHLCCMVPVSVRAQEAMGIVNGNWTGVNRIAMNPANAALGRHSVSINLLSGDLFANSNYIFIHKKDYGFLKLFSVNTNDPAYLYVYDYPEFAWKDSVHYYDYFKDDAKRSFYGNARLMGPSFSVMFGDNTISFLTAFRNNFSAEKVPPDVANFGFRGLDFYPQHHISYNDGYFPFAMLSWIELGAGYARTFQINPENTISAGITLKYLLGTAGAYGTVSDINYMVPYQDTLIVNSMNATFGLAVPLDLATNQFSLSPLVKGKGFSGDIGITWQRLEEGRSGASSRLSGKNSDEGSYLFRAGISMLDAGYIKFNRSVQVHKFNDVSNRIWPGLINFHPAGIQQFFRSASYNLLGDSLASLSDQTSFTIWLPSAASIQFDYNFRNNIYVNATYVQGFRLGRPAVRRETLLAVTPRYETPEWEVNLPLSIVDFKQPAIGLAIRIYSLVIGTEKLGTFLHLTDVKGIDVYFALGINLDTEKNTSGKRHSSPKGCESIREYKRYQVH